MADTSEVPVQDHDVTRPVAPWNLPEIAYTQGGVRIMRGIPPCTAMIWRTAGWAASDETPSPAPKEGRLRWK